MQITEAKAFPHFPNVLTLYSQTLGWEGRNGTADAGKQQLHPNPRRHPRAINIERTSRVGIVDIPG